MNSSTLDSPEEPVDTPLGGGSIGGFGYGLGLSLAVLAIFMIITYASYRCKRRHPSTATTTLHHHHHHRRSTDDDYDSSPAIDIVVNINQRGGGGLDEATISSYPRYTYSQIKPHKSGGGGGGGAAATCSICLADYKDSDLLRLLPQCCHLFHLKCVDPWLLLHATCPVCRKSPPRGGQPPPLAQPAPVTPQ